MATSKVPVQNPEWRDRFPWLLLVRTFRVSVSLQMLFLAGFATFLTSVGWRAADFCFIGTAEVTERVAYEKNYLTRWPGSRSGNTYRTEAFTPRAPEHPALALPTRMVLPAARLFDRNLSWGSLFFYAIGGLWTVTVWGFVGTTISRVAAVQMGREDSIELTSALRFAAAKVPSVMGGSLMPAFGVVLLTLPVACLGVLMRIGLGTFIAGLFWPVVMVVNAMMGMMLLGLLFGWPLVHAAIATEGTDAFDCVSRSYAYSFQRPLQYLLYCLLATVLGTLGWLLVWGFSEGVISLGFWGTSWGSGSEQINLIAASPGELSGMSWAGAKMIGFWVGVVRTLATAFAFSYFWCAITGIYLLLRHDVDATEWDEVFDDRSRGGIVYGLPNSESNSNSHANPPASETA